MNSKWGGMNPQLLFKGAAQSLTEHMWVKVYGEKHILLNGRYYCWKQKTDTFQLYFLLGKHSQNICTISNLFYSWKFSKVALKISRNTAYIIIVSEQDVLGNFLFHVHPWRCHKDLYVFKPYPLSCNTF